MHVFCFICALVIYISSLSRGDVLDSFLNPRPRYYICHQSSMKQDVFRWSLHSLAFPDIVANERTSSLDTYLYSNACTISTSLHYQRS